MTDRVQIIKGFQDVVPPQSLQFARIEAAAREVFSVYGFSEVRLPVLEPTELFARGIGTGTDIVEKEMYTFPDRKGRSLTLRPEGTAGAVRAYLSAGLGRGEPVKWFYSGPMFRYERPQKGRYRQFYQIGAEAIGYEGPVIDADLIDMIDRFFKKLGVNGLSIEINSLGCNSDRAVYKEKLVQFLQAKKEELCEDCKVRLEKNPLRILDCKQEQCKRAIKEAPMPLDHLCDKCRDDINWIFGELSSVRKLNVNLNPMIVRGLDYYTQTVFEFLAPSGLGSQNAVAAGGRYDNLVEDLGGAPTPAIGFAMGVERIALLAKEEPTPRPEYYIVYIGSEAYPQARDLLHFLRERGIWADMQVAKGVSVKSQMKMADKSGTKEVVIIGDEELARGEYKIKNLNSGEQRSENIVSFKSKY